MSGSIILAGRAWLLPARPAIRRQLRVAIRDTIVVTDNEHVFGVTTPVEGGYLVSGQWGYALINQKLEIGLRPIAEMRDAFLPALRVTAAKLSDFG